jgi:hypothetical protein
MDLLIMPSLSGEDRDQFQRSDEDRSDDYCFVEKQAMIKPEKESR